MPSAILPSHEVVQVPRTPQRLSVAITKLVIQEFLVVAGSAYIAGVIYHEAIMLEWPSADLYVAADLFLAAIVELVSLGFGHYKNIQSQPRHAFLWSGFGAVALAFSFLLSTLFLLKIAEPYSRATFVFQFITVEIAVLSVRAFFYSRLQSSIAAGLVNARRVVLVGDSTNCAEFANRLKATGIRTVGSYPFPERLDPDGAVAATYTSPALLLFFNGLILAMIYRAYNIDSVVLGLVLICVGALSYALRLPDYFDFFENFVGLAPVMIVARSALSPSLNAAVADLRMLAMNFGKLAPSL